MKKLLTIVFLLPLLAAAQAVLPTTWNFSSPAVGTPPTGWVYGVGTNGNLTYAFGKNDAIAGRLDATGEYISINFADKPGDLSFYLSPQNAGNAWGGQFDVQESVDGTTWTSVYSISTKATTSTNFADPIITRPLLQTSRWVRFFYTTKLPGGSATVPGGNMAVDLVTITSAPAPPLLLAVKQRTKTLVSGNEFVLGNTANTIFTLQNNGTATNLRIDSIIVSGKHAADFSIGAFDSITPFGGATDSFAVIFNTPNLGSRFATVTIYTNDAEKSPFAIQLYAIGGLLATEPPNQVPSLNITNVKTFGLNVGFAKAANTEKYIVLRKQANALTETPIDGITYKRGDYIGDAQVAYIGNDTATLKPNYILANTGYTFTAFAYNGPDGYENYNTLTPATASITTPNGQPGNYYASVNPFVATFIADLNAKIKQVDTIFYSSYASVVVNNYLARDTTNGRKVVTCVYSNDQYIYNDPFNWWTGQGGNLATQTREHTFAQSWMPTNLGGSWPEVGGKEVSEYHDLHNLFPANQLTANAKRSNNPFGIVVNATYTAPTGFGKLGTNASGQTVYEPKDDQKGDLARALFYMLVRFNGINGTQWRLPLTQDISVLLQWHQQDPPSPIEIARNDYISTVQKNRNPFIDNPAWVNRINFANMSYILDPSAEFITITSPNGGENWIAGEAKNITWTSQNLDTVVIEYRTATNNPWVLISDTTLASRGSVVWQVPAIASSTAKIRIVEKGNFAIIDSSNNVFSIIVPSLTLTSPVGGETWIVSSGHKDSITWTSNNVSRVFIAVFVDDTLFKSLGSPLASTRKLVFITDTLGLPITSKAKVKMFNLLGETLSESANYFSIALNSSIAENSLAANAIAVYPNPTSSAITVDILESNNTASLIMVTDITGRVLMQKEMNTTTTIELANQGIYFVKVQTEKGSIVKKIVVQ